MEVSPEEGVKPVCIKKLALGALFYVRQDQPDSTCAISRLSELAKTRQDVAKFIT